MVLILRISNEFESKFNMKIKIITSLAILSFIISCKTNQIVEKTSEPQIVVMPFLKSLEGKWTLEYMSPVNGKEAKQLFKIQMPYLNFVDATKVAGNNGCNNIAGEYSVNENEIQFDTEKFASTKMFCEGVDETAFPTALKVVNKFDVIENGTKLVLISGDMVTMRFVKSEK